MKLSKNQLANLIMMIMWGAIGGYNLYVGPSRVSYGITWFMLIFYYSCGVVFDK